MIASRRSRLELHYKYLVFDGLSGKKFSLFWGLLPFILNVQAICQICCNFGHCLGLFMLCIWLCSMIVLLLLCFESRPENTDIFKVWYLKESELLQSVSVLDSGTVIKGTAKSTTNCILRSVRKVCVHDIVWIASYSADCCFLYRSLSWSQQHYRFTIFLAASVSFNNIWQSQLDFDWSGSKNRCEALGACVLLKNHQYMVSSQHLRQIECLVFQIVVQWHISHHELMHIDQEHFTSMEHNFLR